MYYIELPALVTLYNMLVTIQHVGNLCPKPTPKTFQNISKSIQYASNFAQNIGNFVENTGNSV